MTDPAPISLYTGRTVHERRAPFTNRFSYRLALMVIDLDRLKDAGRSSRLFSLERFNLYSFYNRDHGPRDGSDLRAWAESQFMTAGIDASDCRIRLMCSPRVLGYVFNPLSIYFAESRENGVLKGVIYQVHNTFGDAHAYVSATAGAKRERHGADKAFHVSPFFDLGGRYEFTLRAPAARFFLSIYKQRENGPDFLATMALKRSPASTANFVKLFTSQPFSTLKTITAIHFEALRLWLKGARYHPRSEPPTGETSTSASTRLGLRAE